MGVTYQIAIRTADRGRRRNYLGQTLTTLIGRGFDPARLHLFPTDLDVAWLGRELAGRDITVHVPPARVAPNANGILGAQTLAALEAAWIGLFEDDIDCVEAGWMLAWLETHADPRMHVYRYCALPGTPLKRVTAAAAEAPLREMRGSQAVMLRRDDAAAFAAWATAHPTDWRPHGAPFQDRPDRGFDKLIGYWALDRWPDQAHGLVAVPMLVNHIGRTSLLHTHGVSHRAAVAGLGGC